MRKQDLLNQLRASREALNKTFEGLSPDALMRPGVVGLWSIKDILAHLTAWESEVVTALAKLDPRSEPNVLKIEDFDDWNAEQYAINAPRLLPTVLEDFHGVHKHLLRAVEALDEKTLTDPRKFRWMEGEPLSALIAENALWHEEEHTEQIRAWREANGL